MKGSIKTIIMYVVMIGLLIFACMGLVSTRESATTLKYGQAIELFREGKVTKFTVGANNRLTLETTETDKNGRAIGYKLYLRDLYLFYNDISEYVEAQRELPADQWTLKVEECDLEAPKQIPWFVSLLPYLLLIILAIAAWFYMANKLSDGERKMNAFSKARVKVPSRDKTNVYFSDVAGADEEKEELREVVEYLRDPAKFRRLGAKIPRGVLLVGPPGTGKTLLAKATAGEADVQLFSVSGSDFVEM